MDRRTVLQIATAAGAAAAVALVWAAWSKSGARARGQVPWSGSAIAWGAPARNVVDVGWTAEILPHPHPIYRQQLPGVTRDALSQYGWAWVSDPPQEQGLSYE